MSAPADQEPNIATTGSIDVQSTATTAAAADEIPHGYTLHTENSARILLPSETTTFLNPIQEFNRDLSVACIRTWGKRWNEARRARWEGAKERAKDGNGRKKRRASGDMQTEKGEDAVMGDTAGAAAGEGGATQAVEAKTNEDEKENGKEKEYVSQKFVILEALSATGLRAIRYAHEIPLIKYVIANDISPAATEAMRRNIALNGLGPHPEEAPGKGKRPAQEQGKVRVSEMDAVYANYGGVPAKTEYCHEIALRLVLHTLSTCAARYGRFITPLLSLSIDFYVRVFVQVRSAPIEVKKVFSKSATYYICSGCQSHHTQPIGRVVEKVHEGNGSIKLMYKAHSGPPLAGPMWSGPIHDPAFVSEVLRHVEEDPSKYGTSARMRGMLTVASEELDAPFYFTPSRLSSFFHCNSPPLESVASALLHRGFEVSRSHACAGSLKTNATRAQVYDIMRSWVKLNPVKMENINEGSPAKKLLAKEPSGEANFARHSKAISRSSDVKLVRYQQNPAPNWGPGSRPNASGNKRKRDETTES
ncbi:RNA methyltransferase tRNA(m5U54)methyltransferase [Ceratobasidium sp. 414]|nr:RNA methyltransferase tRNA(m5U54)methyltransferase [Ceratobasidium sp. 414]